MKEPTSAIFDKALDCISKNRITDFIDLLHNTKGLATYIDDDFGSSLLSAALFSEKIDFIDAILAEINDLTQPLDRQGTTPLMCAAAAIFPEGLALIASKCDKLDIVSNPEEENPYDLLAIVNLDGKNDILVRKIANYYEEKTIEYTSLTAKYAIYGSSIICKAIKNDTLDDDFLFINGMTPLHIASLRDDLNTASKLCDYYEGRWEMNEANNDHQTPLDVAASKEMIDLLKKYGAKTDDEVWDEIYAAMKEGNITKGLKA